MSKKGIPRGPVLKLPDQSTLLAVFDYESNTGLLRWKPRLPVTGGDKIFNARWAGKVAGGEHESGYLIVNFRGKMYQQHRIVWKIISGQDPSEWIDHKDQDQKNNKWDNLRDVSHNRNMWNSKLFHNNTSGFRGVSFIATHQKWRAAISVEGKKRHIGYFDTAEEAHRAFSAESVKYRDEFAKVA